MHLLDVLTLNEDPRDREDLLKIIWRALSYFPEEMWDGVNYLGNVDLEHHLKIRSGEELHGAFVVEQLMNRIRELKKHLEARDLLLALTHDPVVIAYYSFEDGGLRRVVGLVRDYVNREVGAVSLFEMGEERGIKVAAHGLGHHRGLEHHPDPIDLMYVRLLNGTPLREDGFCDECKNRLELLVS
ncbi:hypothetical protein AC482_00455 [miscellaneous Crenarchaeota group-15 archaeon DG-45]|uniref:Peptidase M54 n=1 Tax=miscellaneous Crenarchaeota group-15 archaeon DG-45 TaxID=1685127 RepID=A0A0M0BT29_9ARCH|nr:MAG: hypothetical protein AC482_00455 [miscellaneous Crenarchaeota group-15 archaeon DG-45]